MVELVLQETLEEVGLAVNETTENISLSINEVIDQHDFTISENTTVVIPPDFESRMASVEGGLIQFNNTTHTELNPFTFTSGVIFDIPIRNDGGIFSEAPAIFQNLIDNSDNSINVLNVFDVWDMKLLCKIKTDIADRTGTFALYIGGSIGNFNDFEIKGSPNADTVVKRTIDKWFYQGSTFQANKGFLRGSFDGDGEMYDIVLVFNRKKSGEDI